MKPSSSSLSHKKTKNHSYNKDRDTAIIKPVKKRTKKKTSLFSYVSHKHFTSQISNACVT